MGWIQMVCCKKFFSGNKRGVFQSNAFALAASPTFNETYGSVIEKYVCNLVLKGRGNVLISSDDSCCMNSVICFKTAGLRFSFSIWQPVYKKSAF